jgi:hypothetical protein
MSVPQKGADVRHESDSGEAVHDMPQQELKGVRTSRNPSLTPISLTGASWCRVDVVLVRVLDPAQVVFRTLARGKVCLLAL